MTVPTAEQHLRGNEEKFRTGQALRWQAMFTRGADATYLKIVEKIGHSSLSKWAGANLFIDSYVTFLNFLGGAALRKYRRKSAHLKVVTEAIQKALILALNATIEAERARGRGRTWVCGGRRRANLPTDH